MFIGHFGAGFAAKKFAPRTSLGTLFLAAQFLDLLWPVLLIMGFEQVVIEPGNTVMTPLNFTHYPWSHSLLMVAVWALIFASFYFKAKKYRVGAVVLGLLVLSHWLLDLPMHRPDLPLSPMSEMKVGLGLWNYPIAAVLIELILFLLGTFIYLRSTNAKDKIGKYGPIALIFLFLGIWVGNLIGPPPPNAQAIAIVGNAQWLFVFLAYWIDRHRTSNS